MTFPTQGSGGGGVSAHASTHSDGGSDEIEADNLAGGNGTANQVLVTDGSALSYSLVDTANIAAQAVTTAEIDGSGGAAGQVLDTDGTASGIAWSDVDTDNIAAQAVTTTELDGSGGTSNQFLQTDGTASGATWSTPSASDISDVSADSVTDAHHAKYTNEEAQDAVGNNYDSTLTYDDATPSFGIADGGVDTTQLANQSVTTTEIDGSGGTANQFLQTDGTAAGTVWATPSASDISDVSADSVTDAHHVKYTDEESQDAVGNNFDATLSYTDATPSFGIADGGVDTTQIAAQAVTPTEVDGSGGTSGQVLDTDGTASGVAWTLVNTGNIASQAVTTTEIDGSGGTANQFIQTDGTAAGTTWATPSASDISDVSADSVTDAHHAKYTDEESQDAVGLNFDATLAYDDATPLFGVADGGVDTTQLAAQAVTATEIDGSGGTSGQVLDTDGTASGVAWSNVDTDNIAAEAITTTEIDGSGGTAGQVLDTDGTASGVAWTLVDTSNLADQSVTTTQIDGSGGTADQVLTTDGTASGVTWSDASGGGGFSQTTVTSNHSASDNESIWVDASSAAVTVTLPSPSQGTEVRVVGIDDTNTITVSRNASENIDGVAEDVTLADEYAVHLESDGTNWRLVEGYLFTETSTVTLSSGTATVDTGVTSTSAAFQVSLAVSDPNADADVVARAFWDDSAGTHKIDFIEDTTNVGNPTINYTIERVKA